MVEKDKKEEFCNLAKQRYETHGDYKKFAFQDIPLSKEQSDKLKTVFDRAAEKELAEIMGKEIASSLNDIVQQADNNKTTLQDIVPAIKDIVNEWMKERGVPFDPYNQKFDFKLERNHLGKLEVQNFTGMQTAISTAAKKCREK